MFSVITVVYIYFDFRYRRVPNKYFGVFFFITFFLSILELIDNFTYFREILINKILVLLVSLFIIGYLYWIKIFGGADCKLIILILFLVPYTKMSFNFIFIFYFFFSLYYLGIFSIIFLINRIESKDISFKILFATSDIQNCLKKIFLKTYFSFKDLRDLRGFNVNKYIIAKPELIYNCIMFKLQILIQYRFPLIPVILLGYISTFFIF